MNKRQDSRPETPYLAARQEWNERYGSYISRANNWRLVAFGALAVALVATGGLVAVSMQSKVVPYAVEMSGAGEVVRVRRADVLSRPDANQIRAALRQWVIGARAAYSDGNAMRQFIDDTYAMTLPNSPAFGQLATYHKANNPYVRAAREGTITVDVHVAVPVSDDTWQVEWTETARDRAGQVLSSRNWQGNFTISFGSPSSEQEILRNPLGLYVKDFAWTARLTSSGNQ